MKSRTLATSLFFFTLLLPGALTAHGSAPPPKTVPTAPGLTGSLTPQATQDIRLDMKVAAQKITLFVTDQYKQPVDIGLASATAYVSTNSSTLILKLLPEDENFLTGEGFFNPSRDMKVRVTLRLPGRRPINQEFMPLKN